MSDSFSEVTSESWFSRIQGAIKGILVGLVMFAISLPLLFWNEGRAVQTAKSLDEGSGAVVSVKSESVDSATEGKFVHFSGMATTDETLFDEQFNVSVNAIHLVRNVEMYQWEEEEKSDTKKRVGGGSETVTTYSYDLAWSSSLIDSSSFHERGRDEHQNPLAMPVKSNSISAGNVLVGAYQLPPELVAEIENPKTVVLTEDNIPVEFTEATESMAAMQLASSTQLYLGQSPSSPELGDVRISLVQTDPADVSVYGQQTSQTLQPYQTEAGNALLDLRMGIVSGEQMIEMAQAENRMMAWILRGVGAFLMFLGIFLVLRPISVLADVLPILGNIAEVGVAFIAGVLTISLALTTIAVAWLFYRPMIGVPLLVVAVAGIGFLIMKLAGKKAAA
ncbi:MAG: TMEM43 family protein [Fuerstiella sp.]